MAKTPHKAAFVLPFLLIAGVLLVAVVPQPAESQKTRFRPHCGDASLEIFEQIIQPDQLVRNYALDVDGDDEGLLASALVKNYLRDWPLCDSRPSGMDEGWSVGIVMAYVDCFGLFQLRQLAVEKVIRISKMPLADLQVDGTLGVLDAAYYLEKTDRGDIAEQLYRNLTKSIWPNGAPLEESRIALRAYEAFLARRKLADDDSEKNSEKNSEVKERLDAINTKFTPQTNLYSKHDYFNPPLDWSDAKLAYDAITMRQFVEANKIVDRLVAAEHTKESHTMPSLVRLLNLSRAFARENRTEDAKNLLSRVASFSESEHLLNLRLYLSAELYLLQNDSSWSSSEENRKWAELQIVAKQIVKVMQTGDTPVLSSEDRTPVDQWVADLLANCATAYLLNGEPQKALRIFKKVRTAIAESGTGWQRNSVQSKIAYCYASLGDFKEATRTMQELMNGSRVFIGREVFENTAQIVELCARTRHFSEGEAIASVVLSPFLEKPWVTDAQSPESMRPYDLTILFLAIGELQNEEHRFTEAEKNIKTALEFGFSTPYFRHRARLALGRSLEAQGEYNEAVKIYAVGQTNPVGTFPLFVRLIEASKHTKLSGEEIFAKLQKMLPDALYPQNSAQTKTFRDLLSYAIEQKWDQVTIHSINELVIATQERDGDIKEASRARAIINDPESSGKLAMFQFESGLPEKSAQTVLDALQNAYIADRLESELNLLDIGTEANYIEKLIKCGADRSAEKIIRKIIDLKSEQSEFWKAKLLRENLALAYVYLKASRWEAASDITDHVLGELSRSPIAEANLKSFVTYKDFAPLAELQCLLRLVKILEENNRIQDAIALTKRLLEAELVWYPNGSAVVQDTYVQLANLYSTAHSDENAKRILAKAIHLENHDWSNQQARIEYVKLLKKKECTDRLLRITPPKAPEFTQDLFFSVWRGTNVKLLRRNLLKKLEYLKGTEPRFSQNKSNCMSEIACSEIALGNLDAAREWLKKAERADILFNTEFEFSKPLICYAVVNYKLGQIDKAVKLAKRAVNANGDRYSFRQQADYNGSCAKILAGYDLESVAKKMIPRHGCTEPRVGDAIPVFLIK